MSDNPLPKCRNCKYFYQSIYSGICCGHAPRSAYYNRVNGMDPACVWFEPCANKNSNITMTKCGGDSHVGKESDSSEMPAE